MTAPVKLADRKDSLKARKQEKRKQVKAEKKKRKQKRKIVDCKTL